MYSNTSNGIRASVEPQHLENNSNPTAGVYAFSYTITIENLGKKTVRLLERHWIITSGGQHFAEVVGPGVVGEEPELEAGEMYQYSSSAVIEDPIGSMHGSYTFRSDKGDFLEVTIPQFDLIYPTVLH